MAHGIAAWIKRLFKKGEQSEWNWSSQSTSRSVSEHRHEPRVTFPQLPEENIDQPQGKVVLGFWDGTTIALEDSHPLVADFVAAADRMTRPARWRRLFTAKVGL